MTITVQSFDATGTAEGPAIERTADGQELIRINPFDEYTDVIRVEVGERIPEHVRRAYAVATSGRPGPVLLDVPDAPRLERGGRLPRLRASRHGRS